MKSFPAVLTRGFAGLVRLYPQYYREEFGEEMEDTFSALVQDRFNAGKAALALVGLRELPDLLINLVREHLAVWRGRVILRRYGPVHSLVLYSALLYGIAAGLVTLFGLWSGISILEFSHFTGFTLLTVLLVNLVFYAASGGIFWRLLPGDPGYRKTGKGGFIIPALGYSVARLIFLIYLILYLPKSPIYDPFIWWYWAVGSRLIGALFCGAVFGGLFGWSLWGRRAILPFLLIGAAGKTLSHLLEGRGQSLAIQLFGLQNFSVVNLFNNPWYTLCILSLVLLGGMTLGAGLGWQAGRSAGENAREDRER